MRMYDFFRKWIEECFLDEDLLRRDLGSVHGNTLRNMMNKIKNRRCREIRKKERKEKRKEKNEEKCLKRKREECSDENVIKKRLKCENNILSEYFSVMCL